MFDKTNYLFNLTAGHKSPNKTNFFESSSQKLKLLKKKKKNIDFDWRVTKECGTCKCWRNRLSKWQTSHLDSDETPRFPNDRYIKLSIRQNNYGNLIKLVKIQETCRLRGFFFFFFAYNEISGNFIQLIFWLIPLTLSVKFLIMATPHCDCRKRTDIH